jgi:type II secretory pathway component GspD/PulD (secretin)
LNRLFFLPLSVTLCAFVTLPSGFAQDIPTPPAKANSPIVTQDVNPRLKLAVSMRAQDANLSEILKVLADRSGMNFVTGEGVYKEKITIILNKTPVDEAIDLVVRAAGLSYEIIGNSVLIAEADRLKGEVGQQSYVIALKYANAEEVAGMLGDLTKFIKVDKGGNRIVCFTSPRIINEIERIVKSIDNPHILVSLDTRIVEVSVDNMKKYGINWATLLPLNGVIGYPNASTGTSSGSSDAGSSTSSYNVTSSVNRDGWRINTVHFNVQLDAMINNNDARLLMNSKITTTNNREASLHIGEVVPYTIQSYNMAGNGGGGANMQIQKENVGILLTMTPHVNDANQVTLQLEPEVSNIIAFIGPNKDMPETRVRTTKTTVRVKDGQTILLAGLLDEESTVAVDKVPFLGDIPLVGILFRHKVDHITKKNLIIEITPKILFDSVTVEAKGNGGAYRTNPPGPAPVAPVPNNQDNQTPAVPENK